MAVVQFYTTEGCRLCDEALEMVQPIVERLRFELQVIEIMDNAEAESAYAEHIPVMGRSDRSAPLYWPFSAAAVYRYLA